MIIFNLVVWSIASAVCGFLAWYKSFVEDAPIWPDVPASVGAAGVVIVCITQVTMGWA